MYLFYCDVFISTSFGCRNIRERCCVRAPCLSLIFFPFFFTQCVYIPPSSIQCIRFLLDRGRKWTNMALCVRCNRALPPPRSLSDTGYYYYIYFFIWFFFPFFTMIIGFPVDTQLFFFSFHLFYGRTKQGWADFFFVQRWFMFTTWHQRLCVSHMQCWFRWKVAVSQPQHTRA